MSEFAAALLATITSITVKMNSEFHKNRLTCEALLAGFSAATVVLQAQ